jgi:acyl carrier protein
MVILAASEIRGKLMLARAEIIAVIEEVATEQGRDLALTDELGLIDTGLDSLCLAIIVARLEDRLGFDPFTTADDAKFPTTVGSFIKFYETSAKDIVT